MPRSLSIRPQLVCIACALVALALGCDLTPYTPPTSTQTGDAGATAEGGNDPGGGLLPIDGDEEDPPCGEVSDAGALVSQKDFAAPGQEQLDATHVEADGAAWISLGYDQPFAVDSGMLETPDDRDVVVLRVNGGVATDMQRIGGEGDQHVKTTTYANGIHIVGWVNDAAGGGAASLSVNDVAYPGFVDGDVFYVLIRGTLTEVYRLTGGAIYPNALTIDNLGHAWLVGNFEGTLTLSGTTQAGGIQGAIKTVTGSAPNLNGFVARLAFGDEALTAIGPPVGEGTPEDEARIAGVIPFGQDDGEVIVFGDARGRLQLRNTQYDIEGVSDLWLARMRTDGTVGDRARYSSSGAAYASAMTRTPRGTGVIVGTYSGDLGWLDPPDGNVGMFITHIKLNDLKRGTGRGFSAPTGALRPTSVVRYPWGNGVIITGQFVGQFYPLLGDVAVNTDSTPDGFILALENDLDDRFAWHLAATGAANIRDIATAPCRPAAVVGSFTSGSVAARRLSSSDAPIVFSDAALRDAFLLRLSY